MTAVFAALSPAAIGCALATPLAADAGIDASVSTGPTDEVDLLVVIDNRNHLEAAEEQSATLFAIDDIIVALTSGDRDRDGVAEFLPVRSLRVGVVSGDMGTDDVAGIHDCTSAFGDDGVLRVAPAETDCFRSHPSGVFEFAAGASLEPVLSAANCVLGMQASPCWVQQTLEAPLKALSPAPGPDGASPVTWTRQGYVPPSFWQGTVGHGGPGGANDGFVRPDSVLAIWVVTPFDDCSTPDPLIFSADDTRTPDDALRCHQDPDPRYPLDRYVDGFLGLRRAASRLVFAAVVGTPAGSDGRPYEEILADPLMQETPIPGPDLAPVCVDAARGPSLPGRRLVAVAQRLEAAGAHTLVHCSCEAVSGRPFVGHFLDEVLAAMAGDGT